MSFNVTSPWALYGFTKLNGYATGVALTRNLVSGLGLHPEKHGFAVLRNIIKQGNTTAFDKLLRRIQRVERERKKAREVKRERTRDIPGVEPLENGVKGPCKTSPSDEGDETMDAPGASPCLALRTLGFLKHMRGHTPH